MGVKICQQCHDHIVSFLFSGPFLPYVCPLWGSLFMTIDHSFKRFKGFAVSFTWVFPSFYIILLPCI
ncbi:hypothetical protein CBFG_04787 [Clostridiales bacterium 1_7_47FAA]|nr:hypothetical protein CBFG_04787 [Clostridiales bacterium 1_7_47FAA]